MDIEQHKKYRDRKFTTFLLKNGRSPLAGINMGV
jgi:hypothetical protein